MKNISEKKTKIFIVASVLALTNACEDACTNFECSESMTCRIMLKKEECIEPPCAAAIVYPVCVKVQDKNAENNPCEYGSAFLDEQRRPINCSQADKTCPDGSICEQDPEIGWSLCCSRCYNPGSCAKVEEKPDQSELCKEDCELDGDCGAVKKCCFNGCGQVCTDPIF